MTTLGGALWDAKATTDHLLHDVLTQLMDRGVPSLQPLREAFESADIAGDGRLDEDEFETVLGFVGVFCTKRELHALFRRIDHDGSGCVDWHEFLDVLTGSLSPQREAVIDATFAAIRNRSRDTTANECIPVASLMRELRVSEDPRVIAGQDTEGEMERAWEAALEAAADDQSMIDEARFMYAVREMGTVVPSDSLFQRVMEASWGVSLGGAAEDTRRATAARGGVPGAGCGSLSLDRCMDLLVAKAAQKKRPGENAVQYLSRAFSFCDANDDGRIDVDQFGAAVMRMGVPLTPPQMRSLFAALRERIGAADTRIGLGRMTEEVSVAELARTAVIGRDDLL